MEVKLAFMLLQLLLATTAVLTKSIDSSYELQYIGSFKPEVLSDDGILHNYNENDYYVSPNAAIWANADTDCKDLLGPNATLLVLESEAEWAFVRVMLQNYGFGTTYWMDGTYDPSRQLWIWASNNQPLPPWAPLVAGHPSVPNELLRVALFHYNALWQTLPGTQLHRYICELQRVTVAAPCYQTNDLAIVLDVSGSIGPANFVVALDFVDQLAAAFTRHADSRLTYIVYSSQATTMIPLTNTFTPAQISHIIQTTPYTGGSTATHLGIDMAISQFNSSPRQLPRNMVVLTDGVSNNPHLTAASAARAIALGIRTFAVGITPAVDHRELLLIAGGDPRRVYNVHDFAYLTHILAPLSLDICP